MGRNQKKGIVDFEELVGILRATGVFDAGVWDE